jgi:ribonuclease D
MIYLVTNQTTLFESEHYTAMSVDDSIKLINSWIAIQFDTEADALDQHVGHLLTMQFGSPDGKDQVVVDCTTVNPILYKGVLEAKLLIGHNLKYDLQWLYNYGIHPLNVYCTMIAEQFIYLGFPSGAVKFSLQEVAQRYLGIYIDKEVRGEIRYKGLCDEVIVYAANDVVHLWPIMQKQIAICKERNAVEGCKIECLFTPAVAYSEWCGIKMDVTKWQAKMKQDQLDL